MSRDKHSNRNTITEAELEAEATRYAAQRIEKIGDKLSIAFYGSVENFIKEVKMDYYQYTAARRSIILGNSIPH